MDAPIDYSMVKKNTSSAVIAKSDDNARCSNVIQQEHSRAMNAQSPKKRKTNHAESFFDPDSTITSNAPTVLYICRLCDQTFPSSDGRNFHEWKAHLLVVGSEGSRHHVNGFRIHQYGIPLKTDTGHGSTFNNSLHTRNLVQQIKSALEVKPKVVLPPMELKQPSNRAAEGSIAEPSTSSSSSSSSSSSQVKNTRYSRVITKRRKFACESCPEVFASAFLLDRHTQKHHRRSTGRVTASPLKSKPASKPRSSPNKGEGTPKRRNAHASDEVLKSTVGVRITPYHFSQGYSKYGGHRYVCVLCSAVLRSFETVQRHYQTQHSSKDVAKSVPFQCTLCSAVFENYSGVKGHISVHSARFYECPICDESFVTNKAKFSGHVKSHQQHQQHHHNHRPHQKFRCDYCPKTFQTLVGRVNHTCRTRSGQSVNKVRTRSAAELFRCKFCSREFSSRGGCSRHESVIHSSNRLIQQSVQPDTEGPGLELAPGQMDSSTVDDQILAKERNSILAKTAAVNVEPKEINNQFGCDTCDKIFNCLEDLSEHVRLHADEDLSSTSESAIVPMAAEPAPLRISIPVVRLQQSSSALSAREHAVPSTSATNLENVISEELRTVAETRQKMDQRPIKEKQQDANKRFAFEPCGTKGRSRCSECDESFSDRLQMLIHMSYHLNGEQQPNEPHGSLLIKVEPSVLAPHVCKFCEQRFITVEHLNAHVSKHHRVDLSECEICQELCMGKEELNQHYEQEHTQFRCTYCGLRCLSNEILVHHTEMKCKIKQGVYKDLKVEVKDEVKVEITTSQEISFEREDYYYDDGAGNSSMAEKNVELENAADSESICCNCCNRNFASETDMHVHEKQPQNLLFCCGLCNLYFIDASVAEVHSKMHIVLEEDNLDMLT